MIHGLMARGADREAHSLYLETLAERGLVGAGVFAALVGTALAAVVGAWRRLNRHGLRSEAMLVAAYGSGILGYLTAAIFLHDGYFRYFWMALALAWSLPQAVRSLTAAQRRQPPLAATPGGAQ